MILIYLRTCKENCMVGVEGAREHGYINRTAKGSGTQGVVGHRKGLGFGIYSEYYAKLHESLE
jgi:hypothetical protein